MATELTEPTQNAYLSPDITLAAGTSIVFSVTGRHTGAPIEIRKKDSSGSYWTIVERSAVPNETQNGTIDGVARVIVVNNPSQTAMTLQVFKPGSGTDSGIDQD